jgi:hypothetical protein
MELFSILNLLANCPQTCVTYTIAVYSKRVLMMDRGTVRNMLSFIPKQQLASRIRMELFSILILLANCPQTCMTYTIAVYSKKALMMDRGPVRNM